MLIHNVNVNDNDTDTHTTQRLENAGLGRHRDETARMQAHKERQNKFKTNDSPSSLRACVRAGSIITAKCERASKVHVCVHIYVCMCLCVFWSMQLFVLLANAFVALFTRPA